jgi:pSer/pThr/pTyr-binding forkhead associated (FHA) protein
MGKVLRIMNGPRQGSVYVLEGRTVIGRAGHAEIQLVNNTVSRQHAKLVVDGAGEVTLTDLASDNGTYVNGEAVHRCILQAGDTVCVADTRFLVEDAPERVASSDVFAKKVTTGDSLRQTAPHRIVVRPGAARPAPSAAAREYSDTERQREDVRSPLTAAERRDAHLPDLDAAEGAPHWPGEPAIQDAELARGLDARAFEQVGPIRELPRASPPSTVAASASAPGPAPAAPPPAFGGAPRDPSALLGPSPSSPPSAPRDGRAGRKNVTAEYASAEAFAAGASHEPISEPGPFGRAPEERSVSDRASDPNRRRSTSEYGVVDDWMVASNPDEDVMPMVDEVHGVDVFVDIVAYRELRLRMLRGPALDATDRARFRGLERRLERAPEQGEELSLQRRFQRFECCLRAWVHIGSELGPSGPARVVDVSAGGAQILLGGARIQPGDTTWLVVELIGRDTPPELGEYPEPIRLECRAVWSSPRGARIGVIFAGRSRRRDPAPP